MKKEKSSIRQKVREIIAKRPTMKQISGFVLRYVILIAISALVAVGVEAIANYRLLTLPEDQKGIIDINIEETLYNNAHDSSAIMDFADNPDGLLVVPIGGIYVNKFIYEYDFRDNIDAVVIIDSKNDFGKVDSYVTEDKSNLLLKESVVNIGKVVNRVQLRFKCNATWSEKTVSDDEYYTYETLYGEFDDDLIYIKSFRIDNNIYINWYRIAFAFMLSFLAGFVLLERKRLMHRVEIIFLIISLTMGSFMVFSLPTSKIGYDEEIHFMRSYALSVYPGGGIMSDQMSRWFVSSDETWPYNVPDSVEEREAYADIMDEACSYTEPFTGMPGSLIGTYTSGYVAEAFMLKVARNLGLPFTLMYQLGRLGNLIAYCIIMALAIRKTPCGKWIMAVIGLMPTPLFLASVYSYDATVTCFIYLALAYFLNMLLTKDYKITMWDYLIMGFAFMFGGMPKAVYAPLALLGLLLPKRIFKNNIQMWLMKLGMIAAFCFMFGLNILPTILSPNDVGDLRGGETSEAGQMSYVLGQPFVYAGVLLKSIFGTIQEFFAGRDIFGAMGHLGFSPVVYLMNSLVIGVICTDTVRKENSEKVLSLNMIQRIVIFLVCGFAISLVWTAMYISYTVPGSSTIGGVQGRYYIPVIFMLYMVFNTNKMRCDIDKSWYNVCISGLSMLILGITIWSCIVSPLCL